MIVAELRASLNAEGCDPASYNLAGGYADETYSLERRGLEWRVYYCERGTRASEAVFDSEAEACDRFLQIMRADQTTRVGYRGRRPPSTTVSPRDDLRPSALER